MKIHIWQQFSSNHSASFTVVGRFGSPEKAQAAADEFRSLIHQVHAWQPDTERPEKQFSEKHDVEWPEIDWLQGQYPVSELVKVIDTDVFVMSNSWDTWWLPVPIVTVMAKLGARAVHSELDDSRRGYLSMMSVNLSCTAPDEDKATYIVETIRTHLHWLALWKKGRPDPKLQPEMPWFASKLTNEFDKMDHEISGGIEYFLRQSGRTITCYIQFYRAGFGLPAMVNWLSSLGCTDIRYTLLEDHKYLDANKPS